MNRLRHSTKPGAVSMITVMLMSIILLVLVIGLVQLMLNEQRQSSDNELTNRAFYAAEAGLESARQSISELSDSELQTLASLNLADAPCLENPPPNPQLLGGIDAILIEDDNYRAEVVCQKVAGVNGTYTVGPEIGVNQPKQYDLGTSKSSVDIDWAVMGEEGVGFRSNKDLPNNTTWANDSSPAALRLQFYSFEPNDGTDDLKDFYREFYVLPGTTADGTDSVDFSATSNIRSPVLAQCDTMNLSAGQKMCSIEITGIPDGANRTLYVELSYLYTTTTVDITPLDSAGNLDDSLTGQLRVDTTGRVGDVFRRIQANVDTDGGDNLPGYTILGNQVCKSFDVTDDDDDFPVINNVATVSDYCSLN